MREQENLDEQHSFERPGPLRGCVPELPAPRFGCPGLCCR